MKNSVISEEGLRVLPYKISADSAAAPMSRQDSALRIKHTREPSPNISAASLPPSK